MSQSKKIVVPDIGGANKVDVIAVLIKPGQTIAVDEAIVTLEGDKASMDIPSTDAGVVESVLVKIGDKISEGDVICVVKTAHSDPHLAGEEALKSSLQPSAPQSVQNPSAPQSVQNPSAPQSVQNPSAPQSVQNPSASEGDKNLHASPSIRRIARELDIDLSRIKGTGEKNRITKEDIKKYLSGGVQIAAQPQIDFSKFGKTDIQALSKIKKFSGANLHRNWISIPHITQFNDADITDLESFRKSNADKAKTMGVKLTPIVFIMKAVVAALKQFPIFNSSLDSAGENLILKQYFHIGVAVDTPNGLVVPVIRDVDQKNIFDLAKELGEISEKARTVGLSMKDMQGGCFTISSLGGIGGSGFTPIINAPEVSILGLSKSQLKPVYQADGNLAPRLMLPLSLSYDHRVIDGADGARFIVYLSQCLADKTVWN